MADQDEFVNIQSIIVRKTRRLELLQEQKALRGIDTPPHITIEIEDLKAELSQLRQRLRHLQETPPPVKPLVVSRPSEITIPRVNGWVKIMPIGLALVGLVLVTALGVGLAKISNAPDATATEPAVVAPLSPTLEPMPIGVNVAVAEFSSITGDPLLQPEDGRQVRDALVSAMQAALKDLSPSQIFGEVRAVGPILGLDAASREANAAQLAQALNATIVLYGRLDLVGNKTYMVYPEFYVSPTEQHFDYGEEIIGPTEFGGPVRFTPPLDAPTLATVNAEFKARVEALQYIVRGLANFGSKKDEAAYADFQMALDALQDHPAGQEVLDLLLGAVKMREYRRWSGLELEPDIIPNPVKAAAALKEAERHIEDGLALDHKYARLYLGMGGIALTLASQMLNDTGSLPDSILTRLEDAYNWYAQALPADDAQSPHGYVPVKARFGVGQTWLTKYVYYRQQEQLAVDEAVATANRKLADQAYQHAEENFKATVAAYHEAGSPAQLAELAGQAQALLGKIALLEADYYLTKNQPAAAHPQYQKVINACYDAHQILERAELLKSGLAIYYRAGCYDWQAQAYARQQPPDQAAADKACNEAKKLDVNRGWLPVEKIGCLSLLPAQENPQ